MSQSPALPPDKAERAVKQYSKRARKNKKKRLNAPLPGFLSGDTALHLAALYKLSDEVDKLLAAGADPSVTKASNGSTPLHAAADASGGVVLPTSDAAACVRLLLANGADINHDGLGQCATPAVIAAQTANLPALRALIAGGADLNVQRHMDGSTALHMAAAKGYYEEIQALAEAGASQTITNGNGLTALHLAAAQGRPTCVRILLVAGADAAFASPRFGTALDLARKHPGPGSAECAALLAGDTSVVHAASDAVVDLVAGAAAEAGAAGAAASTQENAAASFSERGTTLACRVCGQYRESGSILRCGHCRCVMYCSRVCQKQDWKAGHKKECEQFRAERRRKHGGSGGGGDGETRLSFGAHARRGDRYYQKKQWAEAEVEFRAALALAQHPLRAASAHSNLATSLMNQGKTAEAVASFRAAVALGPGILFRHVNLHHALESTGDLVGAGEQLAVCCDLAMRGAVDERSCDVRARPHVAHLCVEFGRAMTRRGKHAAGIKYLRLALELQPDPVPRGAEEAKVNAREFLRRADHAWVHLTLAEMLRTYGPQDGEEEEVALQTILRHLERGTELQPNSSPKTVAMLEAIKKAMAAAGEQ